MEPNRLTLCMYTPSAYGGHARYTQELLSALSEVGPDKGIRVSLITSRDLVPGYRTAPYEIHDILPPLLRRDTWWSALHWACSRVIHYAKRESAFLRWVKQCEGCQGIHFQEYTPWLAPRHFRLLKAWGKKLFFTVHNIYPHKYLPGVPKALFDSWNRTAWRLCDALFVHSENLRETLSTFLGPGHPPIFVIPHGIWSFPDGSTAIVSCEERVQHRRLLFFGTIRPNKGLHVLLEAMKELPGYALTVAGAPEERRYQEHIRALVNKLPPTQIELVDRFIEEGEIAQLFAQSSLVVLPYTSFAAQSGVLHDALSYGLPVVATDVGALGESVRRWGIGLVVPPEDATILAGAIGQMFAPECYRRASKAIDRLRSDVSWTRAAEISTEAYRST